MYTHGRMKNKKAEQKEDGEHNMSLGSKFMPFQLLKKFPDFVENES
jgi:hypothetical protein